MSLPFPSPWTYVFIGATVLGGAGYVAAKIAGNAPRYERARSSRLKRLRRLSRNFGIGALAGTTAFYGWDISDAWYPRGISIARPAPALSQQLAYLGR